MTDSVAVFPPGYRLTDSSTGAPISGATLAFYDAGTTTAKTVYGSADLDQGDNPAPLGTSVVTDSLGRPTSDGDTPTDIYVGTAPYKIVIKDADGVVIETKDNRPGAVVSASSVDVSVTATFPVVTKSLDYTVDADDQNTTFLVNCSSGDVVLTLPSATDDDIPNGWKIKVQHAGSANQAIIQVKSGSSQNIYEATRTHGGSSFALALDGEDCEITADGGNWRITSHTPPFIKLGSGIIPIVDRLATSPASPQAGALYLLTGVGGSWSTFTSGDIAQYTGAGWAHWTPYTDCGWVAYVADENQFYSYQDSAWVSGATSTNAGMVKMSTQTLQEAASDNTVAVTPGTQQLHPSAVKVWGYADGGTSPSLSASYNMTSITDGGTGLLSINIATDFSSVNYASMINISVNSNAGMAAGTATHSAGQWSVGAWTYANNLSDPPSWSWMLAGDQ